MRTWRVAVQLELCCGECETETISIQTKVLQDGRLDMDDAFEYARTQGWQARRGLFGAKLVCDGCTKEK